METAGLRAVVGLPTLLDAPAEIGQTTAHVIGRARNLRSGLVILLLCGPRNQIGAGNTARQPGGGDTAGGGLLDPLGLAYEFVVGRGPPRTGDRGVGRTALRQRRNRHTGGLRSGRRLRLGGRLLTALARTVEPVRLQRVVQRRTPVPGTGRRQGLRLLGERRTVRSLARRGGGRTRRTEVVASRRGQLVVLALALLGLVRATEVRPGELRRARRVLALRSLLRVRAVLRSALAREVRPGELGGRAGTLEVARGPLVRRAVEGRVLAGARRTGELPGRVVLLVTAWGVGAPAGGGGTLRLRVAPGQLGARPTGRRKLTAGAAGLRETALLLAALGLLPPGALLVRLVLLPVLALLVLPAGRGLLVLRGELARAAVLPGGRRSAVAEQVGL